jgi:hypothetical protein
VKNLPPPRNFFSSDESSGEEPSGEELSGEEFSGEECSVNRQNGSKKDVISLSSDLHVFSHLSFDAFQVMLLLVSFLVK